MAAGRPVRAHAVARDCAKAFLQFVYTDQTALQPWRTHDAWPRVQRDGKEHLLESPSTAT